MYTVLHSTLHRPSRDESVSGNLFFAFVLVRPWSGLGNPGGSISAVLPRHEPAIGGGGFIRWGWMAMMACWLMFQVHPLGWDRGPATTTPIPRGEASSGIFLWYEKKSLRLRWPTA